MMERIPTIDLCRVPDNYGQVNDFIASLPEAERANATIVMMMTHNFLATAHNRMMDEETSDA
jgi:hypothetical protein